MASGSVHRVAEVVRDLWRREQAQGVSAGEKRLLLKARQVLISELALARSVSDEDASLLLDEVLNAVVV
jgi:CarD family transcriptional regulator